MRMSKELFAELNAAITAKAPIGKDATLRERWDALWASGFPVNRLYDAGLNDSHIDTALCAVRS